MQPNYSDLSVAQLSAPTRPPFRGPDVSPPAGTPSAVQPNCRGSDLAQLLQLLPTVNPLPLPRGLPPSGLGAPRPPPVVRMSTANDAPQRLYTS